MPVVKVFIGGPSQSGKTTTARLICARLGFDHIDLDKDKGIIDAKKEPEPQVKRDRLKSRTREIFAAVARNAVIEGSPLWPHNMAAITQITDKIICGFCGYPNVKLPDKLRSIRQSEFRDAAHLEALSHRDRFRRLHKYRETSRRMQAECQELEFLFADYSDMSTLSDDQREFARKIGVAVNALSHDT